LMPVERAFGWGLALHVALAGLFAYYVARTLGLASFGSLVSGLAYGLGGYVVARWVFPSMVYAAAWLPLMLALAERIVHQAGQGRSRYWLPGLVWPVALLATATALQLLAGHAQTSFYSLLIVAAFALWRAWQTRGAEGSQRTALPAVAGLSLAILWAVALAAIQLLPSAELAAHSQRAGGLTDTQFAYALSFWPWRLISLLAPDFFGNPARGGYWAFGTYWEETAYTGILPLILAALALLAWWRSRRDSRPTGPVSLVPFLAGLALVSLLLALGRFTPLYPLVFRYVPGFGLFQAPARLMIGYALAVPLLAGIGAEALRLTQFVRSALRISILGGIGTVVGGAVALVALPAIPGTFGSSALRLGVTVALAAALLLLRGRRGLRGTRWQALTIALVAVDLLAFGWGLAPGAGPAVYRAPVDSAAFLQAQPPGRIWHLEGYADKVYDRYVALGDFGPSDPTYLQPLRESLLPNLNAAHHLPGAGNYDPLVLEGYYDLYEQLLGPEGQPRSVEEVRPILDLFGVGYLLTDAEMDLPVLYDAGPRIYLNPTALPRALVTHGAR
ncbi:MAG: YfhO family protein, partial [Anaerolineaceae bacterium]|nr:YfhO family protein [Anaerolineaceae bacterium]